MTDPECAPIYFELQRSINQLRKHSLNLEQGIKKAEQGIYSADQGIAAGSKPGHKKPHQNVKELFIALAL